MTTNEVYVTSDAMIEVNKIVFFDARDFPADQDEEGQTLKITFPNGEVYEYDAYKAFVMLLRRGFALSGLNLGTKYFTELVDNFFYWNDFGLEGRTPGYDYAGNWLRAIKEVI